MASRTIWAIYLNKLLKLLAFQYAGIALPPEAIYNGNYLEIESVGVSNVFQSEFDQIGITEQLLNPHPSNSGVPDELLPLFVIS